MGHAAMKKLEGLSAMGGEVPHFDPFKLVIVGLDVPKTAQNWYAHCSRLEDISDEDLAGYRDEILATGKVDAIAKAKRDGDRLVLIDGRRTARAARLARDVQSKQRVPLDERVTVRVQIVKGDDDELYRINLDSHKHQQLTRTQYAKSVLTYYQQVGEDLAKTAAFFRVDPATIKLLLAHFDLSPAAQRAIDEKELPVTVTKQLAKLPRDKQDAAVKEMKEKGATKGARAKAAAEAAVKGESVSETTLRPVPKAVQRRLIEAFVNGEVKKLDPEEKKEARFASCLLRRLHGETGALDPWPRLALIVETALKAKPKTETETAS